MTYNKTKRGLENAAGIVGVVLGALQLIGMFAMLIVGIVWTADPIQDIVREYGNVIYYEDYYATGIALIIVSIIFIALTICKIVFCAKCIKGRVDENGEVVNSTKKNGILASVFSALTGDYVAMGLEIGALCVRDYVEPKPAQQVSFSQPAAPAKTEQTIEQKIAELKHFKELGILDEETYKKLIAKMIEEL